MGGLLIFIGSIIVIIDIFYRIHNIEKRISYIENKFGINKWDYEKEN